MDSPTEGHTEVRILQLLPVMHHEYHGSTTNEARHSKASLPRLRSKGPSPGLTSALHQDPDKIAPGPRRTGERRNT